MTLPSLKQASEWLQRTQVWKSIFRWKWEDTARVRALHVLGNVWLHLHPVKVRRDAMKVTYTWGLGGMSFLLFLILTVTGVFLMFYYRPTPIHAYLDMKDLEFAHFFGGILRNMHRWSAHAMVIVVILHMVRVFLTGAYKTPREFNWGIGVVLLVFTLLLSFSGYLLPWDQLALWAVTVGTNMASATPLLGAEGPFSIVTVTNDARFLLLGGTQVGDNALLRFYVFHCIFFPLIFAIFVIVHLWRIRKDAFSRSTLQSAIPDVSKPQPPDPRYDKVDVWPHLVSLEFVTSLVILALITIWSLAQKAPLEELANPNLTPNPSKAPWYFAGLQELLVYFDPWIAGVMIPTLIIIGLICIPYVDPNPKGAGEYNFKDRRLAASVFMFGIIMWFVLIAIGVYFRGPNWAWYWPGEDWAIHKPPPPPTVNLPNLIGLAFLALYFGAGMAIPRMAFKNFYQALGPLKYVIVVGLLLLMFFVPIKIILRLAFNVKYVVSFPQFNFNI